MQCAPSLFSHVSECVAYWSLFFLLDASTLGSTGNMLTPDGKGKKVIMNNGS